jgi:hypothetical protein
MSHRIEDAPVALIAELERYFETHIVGFVAIARGTDSLQFVSLDELTDDAAELVLATFAYLLPHEGYRRVERHQTR